MSEASGASSTEDPRKDTLDELYEIRDDLETVAETESAYARYAQNALDLLREEGYDA